MSKDPGKRVTRLNSKNQPIVEEMTELQKRRSVIIKAIKKIEKQFEDDETFNAFSRGDLAERKKRLDEFATNLYENNMEMYCGNELSEAESKENDEMEDVAMKLKAKASDAIDKIDNKSKHQSQPSTLTNHSIRVIQTDAAGNVPNTWGTFYGDYAKWHSFRDSWMPIHLNKDIKPITKFMQLKAACLGDAAGASGEWDMTEDNYFKAFERLSNIFEDDYMQIQA